jgi:hypothetical protein
MTSATLDITGPALAETHDPADKYVPYLTPPKGIVPLVDSREGLSPALIAELDALEVLILRSERLGCDHTATEVHECATEEEERAAERVWNEACDQLDEATTALLDLDGVASPGDTSGRLTAYLRARAMFCVRADRWRTWTASEALDVIEDNMPGADKELGAALRFLMQHRHDDGDDRALLALGSAFEVAWQVEREADGEAMEVAVERTGVVVREIENLPPRTIAGARVWARVAAWAGGDIEDFHKDGQAAQSTQERVVYKLLCNLMDGPAGEPVEPAAPCPAASIGADLAAAILRHHVLERASLDVALDENAPSEAKAAAEAAEAENWAAVEDLQDRLSRVRATSTAGAAVQLQYATEMAYKARCASTPEFGDEFENASRRLIMSALAAIQPQPDPTLQEFYVPPNEESAQTAPVADAELLEIGEGLKILLAQQIEVFAKEKAICDVANGEADFASRVRAEAALGIDEIEAEGDRLGDQIANLIDRANHLQATTVAGLRVKALASMHWHSPTEDYPEVTSFNLNALDFFGLRSLLPPWQVEKWEAAMVEAEAA